MRLGMLLWCLVVSLGAAEEHPRLLFPRAMEAEVKRRVAEDSLAGAVRDHVVKRAERALDERTCEYRIPDGKRLLGESRHALHQVLHCGMAWRLGGGGRFRERVVREMDAACALKDWNPSHFLDVAEMATAVAIGYDWLYPTLDEASRRRYEDALVKKALRPLDEGRIGWAGWWKAPTNNWSQVCAAGIGLAAEMAKHREPDLCGRLAKRCVELVDGCARFYGPDGAYPEGPDYWHYGTNYHVLALAAWDGLGMKPPVPGVLRRSGDSMMHGTGPFRLSYNFADGNVKSEVPSPAQSWLARRFDDAGQARHVRRLMGRALEAGTGHGTSGDLRYFPLHLLWLPEEPAVDTAPAELAAVFRGEQPLVFFRSGWEEKSAWLAAKGGTGAASHGHLDAGSFVYDAAGVRWFHDLGKEDYNLPGYFGGKRWEYFRLTNHSHGTLTIGGKLQAAPEDGATISALHREGTKSSVEIDLSPVYPGQASNVVRALRFDSKDGSVEIRDTVESPVGAVRWAVVTRAAVKLEGPQVVLEEGGRRLVMERRDDAGGAWEEYSLKPPTAEENPNNGFRMIGFTVPAAGKLGLEVVWRVDGDAE